MIEEKPKMFVAMKAFITNNGKILILKESAKYEDGANSGRFDVVGGRVKPGQHFKDSLIREIKEETGLNVKIKKPFHVGEWRPKVKGEQWHIIGTYFECTTEDDKVTLSKDHDEFLWINPEDYKNHNLIINTKSAFEAYLNKST